MSISNCLQINSRTDNVTTLAKKSFLLIFFCLMNIKDEEVILLIQYLQKYDLNFGQVRTSWQLKDFERNFHVSPDVNAVYMFLSTKANYVARSKRMISKEEFQQISQYLISITTLVVFFYQNKILDLSRLQLIVLPENSKINIFNNAWKSLSRIHF